MCNFCMNKSYLVITAQIFWHLRVVTSRRNVVEGHGPVVPVDAHIELGNCSLVHLE